MKNIHLSPTEKPSSLFKDDFGRLIYSINIDQEQNHFEPQNIYITSDEEIKEGDWIFDLDVKKVVKADNLKVTTSKKYQCWYYKKIILTTDEDLIKDGLQAIDDEFLEWFVNNPSCEKVKVQKWSSLAECGYSYHIIILKEEPKPIHQNGLKNLKRNKMKETLEEAAERIYPINFSIDYDKNKEERDIWLEGAKWEQERSYSKEDLEVAFFEGQFGRYSFNDWFEQFKKK